MKKNFGLAMPPWKYIAAPAFNVGALAAATWAGVPLRERDRDVLPVLHTRGFVNAANSVAPSTTPAPTYGSFVPFPPFFINRPLWVEPPKYWGKQGTLLRTPRSLAIADNAGFSLLLDSAVDGAALDAAGVFRFNSAINSNYYNGLFLNPLPWQSLPTGSLGDGATGHLPVVDPATFVAGDVLVILGVQTAYYNNDNFTGSNLGPSIEETALLNSDLAAAAAALSKFNRLRFRLYSTLGRTGEAAFYNSIVTRAVAAGLDASYTNASMTLASIQADYHNFFGI